jgi:hypothetical protein
VLEVLFVDSSLSKNRKTAGQPKHWCRRDKPVKSRQTLRVGIVLKKFHGKFNLEPALKAQTGVEVQLDAFCNLRMSYTGVGGQHHASAALHPGKRPGIDCTGG